MSAQSGLEALNAPAHIARVRLKVRDIDVVRAFYSDLLGLEPSAGTDRCTLSAADGTVLVELVAGRGLKPAVPAMPGLFHTAFLLPTRRDLANWAAHATRRGVRIEGASDHLVSEAIYLSDPEGNGIEVYVDRPRAQWPMEGALIKMATLPLDGASLMAEQDGGAAGWRFPAEGHIGHVHLKVVDLALAEAFYREHLGMTVMARYPGASFMGWGGYHHHIAVNVWQSKDAAPDRTDAAGLDAVVVSGSAVGGLVTAGMLTDPSGNQLLPA